MLKTGVFALCLFLAPCVFAQSIKTFEPLFREYPLGSKLHTERLQRIADPPSLLYDAMYSVNYDRGKTLYGRPVQDIALGIRDDTIAAIIIYVSFDSTLHKDLERELGPPELGWMGFAPGTDTVGVIWTRYWDFQNYSVGFNCTRYQYQIGEVKRDLIAISLMNRRRLR